MDVHLEAEVNLATANGYAAWTYDLDHWGVCGQGTTASAAVEQLRRLTGHDQLRVVETIVGDEQAFRRDALPATRAEIDQTLRILADARRLTVELISDATPAELDRVDPDRILPEWAQWYSARQLAWHIADTESRYYLPSLGLPFRPRAKDLIGELTASAAHVREVVANMDPALLSQSAGEKWTSVKLLRRLAWHERGELLPLVELLG